MTEADAHMRVFWVQPEWGNTFAGQTLSLKACCNGNFDAPLNNCSCPPPQFWNKISARGLLHHVSSQICRAPPRTRSILDCSIKHSCLHLSTKLIRPVLTTNSGSSVKTERLRWKLTSTWHGINHKDRLYIRSNWGLTHYVMSDQSETTYKTRKRCWAGTFLLSPAQRGTMFRAKKYEWASPSSTKSAAVRVCVRTLSCHNIVQASFHKWIRQVLRCLVNQPG